MIIAAAVRCAACRSTVAWVRTTSGLTIAATPTDRDGDLRLTGKWAPQGDGTEIPVVTAVRGGQLRRHRDVCPVPSRRRWSTSPPRRRAPA